VESLSPGIWPLIEIMGSLGGILQEKFVRPELTLIHWEKSGIRQKAQHAGHKGLLVDRRRFDSVLLRTAIETGVHVVRSARVRLHGPYHEGKWRLDVEGDSATTIECRYLIDASGRQGFLGRGGGDFGGCYRATSPPTVALCGCLQSGVPPGTTMVEAIADGWIWGASLTEGRCAVMVLCDTERVRADRGKGLEAIWRGFLSKAELFRAVAEAKTVGSLHLRDATASFHRVPISEGFLRAGESNYSIDPLSSTGVEKAMRGGLTAGTVVHTLLKHPERANLCEQFYLARQQEDVYRHAAWAAAFYGEAARFADRPFWKRRAHLTIPEPNRTAAQSTEDQLADAADTEWTWSDTVRVRLAGGVELRREPCIVGNEIEPTLSIMSPKLERPVAFLNGIPIGTMLGEMIGALQPRTLVPSFVRHIPAGQIAQVWCWLLEKRIFEVIPPGE